MINHLLSILLLLLSLNLYGATELSDTVPGEETFPRKQLSISPDGFIHGFGKNADPDIYSPKSVNYSKDGKKIYINSLEGCKTVVYDAVTREKIKVIQHKFDSGEGELWLSPSGFYQFTHYPQGEKRGFYGKPVEAAFSKDGNFLFVPFYRRSFDINAQDPSALAVIDTRSDEIVLMAETGPLPKMVKVSEDGALLAITHWGDNTVGLMDISSPDPKKWRHLPPVTVGGKLELNYSLSEPVNRDAGSGFLLRGTVFLPGDSILLVSGMAGPMAVIDVKERKWLGMIDNLYGVRHITLKGDNLFMSRNSAGEVLTVPVINIINSISSQRSSSRNFKVDGIRRAKVGGGARTLKVSPSGKYIFVACNGSSEIAVLRSEDMCLVASVKADDFPVGLDISPSGETVISTSQGKNGVGGNAVNFFKVVYPEKELPVVEASEEVAVREVADSVVPGRQEENEEVLSVEKAGIAWIVAAGVMLLLIVGLIVLSRLAGRKNRRS